MISSLLILLAYCFFATSFFILIVEIFDHKEKKIYIFVFCILLFLIGLIIRNYALS
ncbi:hypothetical protein M2444_005597 [Paenibacillus sp. PastF-3]|nr:hypothetical protein [Paenibacillus sp. PastF-3]